MDKTEVYTSKKKSIPMLLISSIFVAYGVWLIINADNLDTNFLDIEIESSILNRSIGIVAILFFGIGVVLGIKRLIKPQLILIMDSNGLNINPKKSLTEFIKWNDIYAFDQIRIKRTKIMIVRVHNPEYWLEKETNLIRKRLMKFNINKYNSPFNIVGSGLEISYHQLNEKLNGYMEKYRS
ncbi:hypothetical protein D7030_04025 [Flavobacteriaceae bacterium AU392]|nr:hypothetical protein D1817_10500 [Flavobacteriaceae bacterium]RKM85844.1 hypothetical protein D7030_04025 [Flavobacteriaceae bacterium AU392]